MGEPNRAVFLSYASQDAQPAKRICDALRAAGIEVWFDQSELRGGDAWDQKIRRQIHECALFIPIISSNTQARPEGYFRLEWRLADQRTYLMGRSRVFLVPVCIDDTLEANADAPDSFLAVQWVRLRGGEAPPAVVERIMQLLCPDQHLPPASAHTPAQPSIAPAFSELTRVRGSARRSRLVRLLIAAVAIIGLGYFVVDRLLLSKRPAAGTQFSSLINLPAMPARSAIPEKSIAVLPFVDLSEKHDQGYFADGMAEEIINLLVKIPELKVIGRTSSFQFKGTDDDLRKIGATLGIAYVVEGSVRRAENRIRVAAQLIDTRDGTHRWSEQYDRDAGDVLKVQDEIAAGLVRALQLEIAPSTRFPLRWKPKNAETYDLYLRGLHAADKFNQSGFEEAVVDFRSALELDSSFVPAAEALTQSLMFMAGFAMVPEQTGWQRVREAAEATLRLNPRSAVAHGGIANAYEYDWNWPAAERELSIAVALAPTDSEILTLAADESLIVGSWAQAAHYLDTARAIDPLQPYVHEWSCWVYQPMGRLAEAEQACRRALQISPTFSGGAYNLGIVLLLEGKAEDALTQMQEATDPSDQLTGLALAFYALHRRKEADAALERLEAEHAEDNPMAIADVYAFTGQNERALKWLAAAVARRDHNISYIKSDPFLKKLQQDLRYKLVLRKVNLSG
jgi:TolB-like protein